MADRQNETIDQPVGLSIDRASLPVVPAGEQLIEHEVYLDLANLGHGPIVAMPGQILGGILLLAMLATALLTAWQASVHDSFTNLPGL